MRAKPDASSRSRRTRGAGLLLAVLLTPALSGCALLGRRKPESPEVIARRAANDERIRTELEARLAAEPLLGRTARVRVVVEDAEVSLYGTVAGFAALRCADTNAELVPGVRLVIDHLELAPGPVTGTCRAPRVFRGASGTAALAARE